MFACIYKKFNNGFYTHIGRVAAVINADPEVLILGANLKDHGLCLV